MTFTYFAHAAADVGKERTALEDCVRVEHLPQGGVVAIVCDGMGGAEGGALAARTALLTLVDACRSQTSAASQAALRDALLAAHGSVLKAATEARIPGMGTTAVIAWCESDKCHVGWVGDSRMYHFRRGELNVRTSDHSKVQERVDRGELTPEQAAAHPDAHKLSQALGSAHGVVPSVWPPLDLEPGDLLLLCSDGLYDMLDEAQIGALLAEDRDYAQAVQALVDEANQRGGHDNIGVALIVVGQRRTAPPNGRPR